MEYCPLPCGDGKLIPIEEVAEKTYRLETPVPGTGLIFSVYLIHVDGGVLVEPGPTTAIPSIQEGMKRLGMNELSWIIPTHIHMDHSGGTGTLASIYPNANVIAHPRSAFHIVDPTKLVQSTRISYGNDFENIYGPILPVIESRVMVPADGESISAGERELQIVYAPGHAPHHIAIFDMETKCLFCGEALGMATADPLPAAAAPSFDLEDCLNTMDRLKVLKPSILLYSHGGVGLEPQKRISRVIENTQYFAEMIQDLIRNGGDAQSISRKVTEYSSAKFPPEWEEDMIRVWRTGIVEGYTIYFKNKEMM